MTTGIPVPRRYFAIFALSAGSLMLMIDSSIASVALPSIAYDLGITNASAVLVVTLYQLVLAMTIMAFSALGDRVGQRHLYQAGLLLNLVGGILSFFTRDLTTLLAARMLSAVGTAAGISVTFGLVRAIYPSRQLGRGLGINTLASASGTALAPPAAGLVLSLASWHWIFVAGVPVAILSLIASRALPDPHPRHEPFDKVGAALCAATFGLVIVGLEKAVDMKGIAMPVLLLGLGLAIGATFVFHELRQRNPVLPIDLLSSPAFAVSVVAGLAGVIASSSMLLWMPFRLQHGYGFTPAETGAMIAPYAFATLICAPTSGMLTDRIAPKILGGVGLAIGTLALVNIGFFPVTPDHFDVAWRMAVCGVGFGLFFSPNARIVLGSIPAHRAAAAGGLISTTRMVGLALSATLVGALLSFGLGDGPVPAFVAAALAAVALLSTVLRPDHVERETADDPLPAQ